MARRDTLSILHSSLITLQRPKVSPLRHQRENRDDRRSLFRAFQKREDDFRAVFHVRFVTRERPIRDAFAVDARDQIADLHAAFSGR